MIFLQSLCVWNRAVGRALVSATTLHFGDEDGIWLNFAVMTTPPESGSSASAAVPLPPVLSPPRVLGNLEEFNANSGNISSYLERLQLYFEANKVEEDRRVPVLLTVIGSKAYDTLRSLLAPTLPGEKTFSELLDVLKKHFDPQPLVIAERFRFYKRSQKPDESIADFIASLGRLSIKCEFGEFLDQALRDRFVCGVHSGAIQMKLLVEAKLTIRRAQEIAQGMESADRDAKDLKGDADQRTRTADSAVFKTTFSGETSHEKKCYRCGRRQEVLPLWSPTR